MTAIALLLALTVHAFSDDNESEETNQSYDKGQELFDPISANAGAYYFTIPLLDLGGPMDLDFSLIYRSDLRTPIRRIPNDFPAYGRPNLTRFWWTPRRGATFSGPSNEFLTVCLEDGALLCFTNLSGGVWQPFGQDDPNTAQEGRHVLQTTTNSAYLADLVGGRVTIFDIAGSSTGRVRFVVDRNQNMLTYSYTNATDNSPASITDGLGRRLDFTYEQRMPHEKSLTKVRDQAGREVRFLYEYGADNGGVWTLRSVVDAAGGTNTFGYQPVVGRFNDPPEERLDCISARRLPRGNTPYRQAYAMARTPDGVGLRVANQEATGGMRWILEYGVTNYWTKEWRSPSKSILHEYYSHHSSPKRLTDTDGNSITFSRNDRDQTTRMVDREGGAHSFRYDGRNGALAAYTNAIGAVWQWERIPQQQSFTNPANGEVVSFTFYDVSARTTPRTGRTTYHRDSRGNVLSRTNALGHVTRYSYNARGQIATVTNATGGVTLYAYDTNATLASVSDSDRGPVSFEYDAALLPVRIVLPDSADMKIAYDRAGRVIAFTNANGHATVYSHDANGNVTGITDAAGQTIALAYDVLDRATNITDRTGGTVTYERDTYGHIIGMTDAAGIETTHNRNHEGRVVDLYDDYVGRWRYEYNRESARTAAVTPLGHRTEYGVDLVHNVTSITNPLGAVTRYEYDGANRIVRQTDPAARTNTVEYDAAGRLRRAELGGLGAVQYEYSPLGMRTAAIDPQGNRWTYGYSPMGLLSWMSDPLTNTWTFARNERGWTTNIVYPNGDRLDQSFDGAGNVTNRIFSGGLQVTYDHDHGNRLASAPGLALQRDASGRITNCLANGQAFTAGWDAAGRLTNVTYAGLYSVTYTYENHRPLLSTMRDNVSPGGGSAFFTYDDDWRLIEVRRGNNLGKRLTYDAASRVIRHREGTLLSGELVEDEMLIDLSITRNAAGEPVSVDGVRPLNVTDGVPSDVQPRTFDPAAREQGAGVAHDARGRVTAADGRTFTWDAASRLAAVGGPTLTYDGLNGIVSCTVTGRTTRFYRNHAIAGAPIVAEQDADSGEWLRFYAWTPDGRLQWMVDAPAGNKVYYYHFDHMGSTLALTRTKYVYPVGARWAVVARYAYSPFGRLLRKEGNVEQSFTFIGERGVRQQGDEGDLYQMRYRYYDARRGRFLTREPEPPDPRDVPAANPYQYVGHNPVHYLDPYGLDGGEQTAKPEHYAPPASPQYPTIYHKIAEQIIRKHLERLFGPRPVFVEEELEELKDSEREWLQSMADSSGLPLLQVAQIWAVQEWQGAMEDYLEAESRTVGPFVPREYLNWFLMTQTCVLPPDGQER